jgi:hypothetical protein
MVSKRQPRRRNGLPLKCAALLALVALACSRRAEIENAPDTGGVVVTEPPRPDGGVPVVTDAGLDNAEGLACPDRPIQVECQGANDFPCDFDGWLQNLAEQCQRRTQCTDGWVEVQLGSDGCAAELRMEDPDPPYVACLTEELSQYRCPCQGALGARFLGLGHGDCTAGCSTGELRCPPGSTCQNDQCVSDRSAGGADDG